MFGKMTISTNPASEVWFNGQKLGETPLANVRLPAGDLVLDLIDLNTRAKQQVKVTIAPNTTRAFKFPQ
jgi:hypothetical protein